MDVLNITDLYKTTPVTSNRGAKVAEKSDFGSIFKATMNLVEDTNTLQNKAQNEQIKFLLGEADNTHDLMIAERKAQIALQYTVAVRDRFVQGYQTLMQIQV